MQFAGDCGKREILCPKGVPPPQPSEQLSWNIGLVLLPLTLPGALTGLPQRLPSLNDQTGVFVECPPHRSWSPPKQGPRQSQKDCIPVPTGCPEHRRPTDIRQLTREAHPPPPLPHWSDVLPFRTQWPSQGRPAKTYLGPRSHKPGNHALLCKEPLLVEA